jgi:hypothetical protein
MESPSDKNVVLLYAVILAFFSPTLLGVSAAMQYVLPLWVIIKVIGRRPAAAKVTSTVAGSRPVAASS